MKARLICMLIIKVKVNVRNEEDQLEKKLLETTVDAYYSISIRLLK